MEEVIQVEDCEQWMRITGGPLMSSIKNNEGKDIPNLKAQYGEADYKVLGKIDKT